MDKVVIGDCTLWHGDCAEVLLMLQRHDLLLTDPPYGIGFAAQPSKSSREVFNRKPEDWDNETPEIKCWIDMCIKSMVWGGNHFELPISRGWLAWIKPPDCQHTEPQSFVGQT